MDSKNNGKHIDTSQTLEQIENNFWGKTPNGASGLIGKCYELRRKKIDEFETEDFRLLIGQNIGLPFLVPLAIEILRENPLAEGDYYEGDLMHSLLKIGHEFWKENRNQQEAVVAIFEGSRTQLVQALEDNQRIKNELIDSYNAFVRPLPN